MCCMTSLYANGKPKTVHTLNYEPIIYLIIMNHLPGKKNLDQVIFRCRIFYVYLFIFLNILAFKALHLIYFNMQKIYSPPHQNNIL